jgi:hypothetical protein
VIEREHSVDARQLEAAQQLAEVEARRRAVERRAPWEYRGYIGWGLFVLLFLPPLDFISHAVWGPVIFGASLVGTVATSLYYHRRSADVHLGRAMQLSRWWRVWLGFALWYAIVLTFAFTTQDRFALAWTLAGVAAAIPLFVVGWRVARLSR